MLTGESRIEPAPQRVLQAARGTEHFHAAEASGGGHAPPDRERAAEVRRAERRAVPGGSAEPLERTIAGRAGADGHDQRRPPGAMRTVPARTAVRGSGPNGTRAGAHHRNGRGHQPDRAVYFRKPDEQRAEANRRPRTDDLHGQPHSRRRAARRRARHRARNGATVRQAAAGRGRVPPRHPLQGATCSIVRRRTPKCLRRVRRRAVLPAPRPRSLPWHPPRRGQPRRRARSGASVAAPTPSSVIMRKDRIGYPTVERADEHGPEPAPDRGTRAAGRSSNG